MRITKTLFISAVLLMSATGLQAAGFVQKGNYLTVQLKQHQNFGPSLVRSRDSSFTCLIMASEVR